MDRLKGKLGNGISFVLVFGYGYMVLPRDGEFGDRWGIFIRESWVMEFPLF